MQASWNPTMNMTPIVTLTVPMTQEAQEGTRPEAVEMALHFSVALYRLKAFQADTTPSGEHVRIRRVWSNN